MYVFHISDIVATKRCVKKACKAIMCVLNAIILREKAQNKIHAHASNSYIHKNRANGHQIKSDKTELLYYFM